MHLNYILPSFPSSLFPSISTWLFSLNYLPSFFCIVVLFFNPLCAISIVHMFIPVGLFGGLLSDEEALAFSLL